MAVQNPTNQTITIKSITGSVSVNDKYLANVSAFGDQKVIPNSESILRLTARPSATGVFQSIRELLTQPVGTISASFQGTANVDGIVVPISESRIYMNASVLMGRLAPFKNQNEMLTNDQSTRDIIEAILEAHKKYQQDYSKISSFFNAGSRRETARKIWIFSKK
jgi:hypothetical protein